MSGCEWCFGFWCLAGVHDRNGEGAEPGGDQ